ncbi:MAG: hypothetical protein JO357_16050 [Hyphomicrobiales bacterium]|nr:hypothetical protein [Hyphomicrobiales bacterium]MBV9138566.1 hypothetical protein [Hyphomicrobiales bacterium]
MSRTLEIVSIVVPIVSAMIAVAMGASKVRFLREATGDKSLLTAILGGSWLVKIAPKDGR